MHILCGKLAARSALANAGCSFSRLSSCRDPWFARGPRRAQSVKARLITLRASRVPHPDTARAPRETTSRAQIPRFTLRARLRWLFPSLKIRSPATATPASRAQSRPATRDLPKSLPTTPLIAKIALFSNEQLVLAVAVLVGLVLGHFARLVLGHFATSNSVCVRVPMYTRLRTSNPVLMMGWSMRAGPRARSPTPDRVHRSSSRHIACTASAISAARALMSETITCA